MRRPHRGAGDRIELGRAARGDVTGRRRGQSWRHRVDDLPLRLRRELDTVGKGHSAGFADGVLQPAAPRRIAAQLSDRPLAQGCGCSDRRLARELFPQNRLLGFVNANLRTRPPQELDAITGAAVRAAHRLGVPAPVLESLLEETEAACRARSH